MRPVRGALLHAVVEIRDGQRAGSRIAADLVESQQPMKAIESGILQRLCHHRTGELLHFEREAAVTCDAVAHATRRNEIEGQRVAQEIEDVDVRAEPVGARLGERALDDRAILAARPRRSDVGSVDREVQDEQRKCVTQALGGVVARAVVAGGDAHEQAPEHREFAVENVCNHPPLGLDENGIEAGLLAAHVAPSPGEPGKSTMVEQEARKDVQPFVSCCAGDPGKARQALRVAQDLFRHDVERSVL